MKIEVGKFYVTRSGRKVGPIEKICYGDTAYSKIECWWLDGRKDRLKETLDDIVAELKEENEMFETKKTFKEGVYGIVNIYDTGYDGMYVNIDGTSLNKDNSKDIRDAAKRLIEIADYLDAS